MKTRGEVQRKTEINDVADLIGTGRAGTVPTAPASEPIPAASPPAKKKGGGYADFKSVNESREVPPRADVARVITTIFIDDVDAEWKLIDKWLKTPALKLTEHGHLNEAVAEAANYGQRAAVLLATAQLLHDKWELENKIIHAAMWTAANEALESQKKSGQRSKNITLDDVEMYCADEFADQWVAQETKKAEFKRTLAILESLAKRVNEHGDSLRGKLAKTRG